MTIRKCLSLGSCVARKIEAQKVNVVTQSVIACFEDVTRQKIGQKYCQTSLGSDVEMFLAEVGNVVRTKNQYVMVGMVLLYV